MRLAHRIDGPPGARVLVLLGSIGSTSAMWSPVVGPLQEQFRVVRIDHRGHGASPAASRRSDAVRIADLATDVVETLDALGLERVDFAGLSLGGMVGMWLAAHRPQRIGRLALVCTAARMDAALWHERAAIVRANGMPVIAESVVARWLTPELAARDAALVGELREMVASVDAESYAQCGEAIASMDLRADLRRISAPTLLVAGRQDPATPPSDLQAIADALGDASVTVLDPAAHVLTYEQPGALAGALLDHFRAGATVAAGMRTRRAVLGDEQVDATMASTTALTEPFQDFITRYAWGDVWSRDELSRRERSIATIAALVTLGSEHELAMHVRAARRNGLSDVEIVEILMHVAVYAGLPRANRAVAIAREVLDDR